MARKFKLLPGFTNVGPSKTAILQVPLGEIYQILSLPVTRDGGAGYAAMTVAQQLTDISAIRVKVNDNVIQDWKPTDLHKVNGFSGAQFAARDGYIDIYFLRPDRRTMEGEEAEGWGTSDIQNFSIEVDFSATPTGVTIGAYAITAKAANRPLRAAPIRHIRRLTFAPGAAGTAQLDKIIKGVNIFYARMHFLSSLVTSVKITVDDRIEWHDLPRAQATELFAIYELVQQSSTYTVAFDLSRQLTDQLPTFYPAVAGVAAAAPVQDFRVDVTVSGAGSFDVILEQYRYIN